MEFYPTKRAIALAGVGAPAALLVAALAPGLWVLAAGWIVATAALLLADAALAAASRGLSVAVAAPELTGVGRDAEVRVQARFARAAPRTVEVAIAADDRLELLQARRRAPLVGAEATAAFQLRARRRGASRLEGVWIRWKGPLGLVWRQHHKRPARAVAITPDLEGVRDAALKLFARGAPLGLKAQLELGDGAEFHALKDFQTGMDLRAIDWKQSARHGKLVGREYRAERNHSIILAIDSGRLMSAPVGDQPRVDRAVSAALLLGYVGLRLGDRVGLFAFDSRPRQSSGVVTGVRAFPALQRLAAEIDYSTEETNFTLALTSLAGRLDRRALVVIFTDFADPTSAGLMLEHVGRLARTHLIVLTTFRDEELEALRAAEPRSPEDVSRAVVAAALLAQRESVLAQLRRLGVQVLEARADELGPALIDRYIDVMRRELI